MFETIHWVKDKKLKFISCSENLALLAGFESSKDIIGKSDEDLIWSDRAKYYLEEEKIVLSGQHCQRLQIQNTVKGKIKIFVTKSPVWGRNNRMIGTMGSSIDLSNYFITKLGFLCLLLAPIMLYFI